MMYTSVYGKHRASSHKNSQCVERENRQPWSCLQFVRPKQLGFGESICAPVCAERPNKYQPWRGGLPFCAFDLCELRKHSSHKCHGIGLQGFVRIDDRRGYQWHKITRLLGCHPISASILLRGSRSLNMGGRYICTV